jgi:class 3 adenylate cyclase
MFAFFKKNREEVRLKRLMEKFVGEAGAKLDINTKYEEKIVGLLLIRLNNYEQLCMNLNHDDLACLLNTYYAKSVSCIHKYGGNVDNLMGSKVFAIFGAPVMDDDLDKNGILSTIDILDVFEKHNTNTTNIDLHISVTVYYNIGIAMVGNFGCKNRLTYTAIGNEVNMLFRYSKIINRNSIILNFRTLNIVRKYLGNNNFKIDKLPHGVMDDIDDQGNIYEILQIAGT